MNDDTIEAIARIIDPGAGWDRRPSNSENPDTEREDAEYDRRQSSAWQTARRIDAYLASSSAKEQP